MRWVGEHRALSLSAYTVEWGFIIILLPSLVTVRSRLYSIHHLKFTKKNDDHWSLYPTLHQPKSTRSTKCCRLNLPLEVHRSVASISTHQSQDSASDLTPARMKRRMMKKRISTRLIFFHSFSLLSTGQECPAKLNQTKKREERLHPVPLAVDARPSLFPLIAQPNAVETPSAIPSQFTSEQFISVHRLAWKFTLDFHLRPDDSNRPLRPI